MNTPRDILGRRYDILSQRAPEIRAWLKQDDPYHELKSASDPTNIKSLGRDALVRYEHILGSNLEYGIETPEPFVRLDALASNLHAASQLCYDLLQMPERMTLRQAHDISQRGTYTPPPPLAANTELSVMSEMMRDNRQERYNQLQRPALIDSGIDHTLLTRSVLNDRIRDIEVFRQLLDVQTHPGHQPLL